MTWTYKTGRARITEYVAAPADRNNEKPGEKAAALDLSVAAILPRSLVNGPGVRSVLWVQGCPRRCAGCCNPGFQAFEGGAKHTPAAIAGLLLAAPEIEGVTFSGGEPFAQAEALAVVARLAQRAGKGVVIFTGFAREELFSDPGCRLRALLSHADLLIAGPYRQEMPSPHPYLASANQEIVHLTERYRHWMPTGGKRAEFRIAPDGGTVATGFPVFSRSEETLFHGGRVIEGARNIYSRISMPEAGNDEFENGANQEITHVTI